MRWYNTCFVWVGNLVAQTVGIKQKAEGARKQGADKIIWTYMGGSGSKVEDKTC